MAFKHDCLSLKLSILLDVVVTGHFMSGLDVISDILRAEEHISTNLASIFTAFIPVCRKGEKWGYGHQFDQMKQAPKTIMSKTKNKRIEHLVGSIWISLSRSLVCKKLDMLQWKQVTRQKQEITCPEVDPKLFCLLKIASEHKCASGTALLAVLEICVNLTKQFFVLLLNG